MTNRTVGTRRRFVQAMTDYCNGALDQVDLSSHAEIPDANTSLATRRKSAGVTPLFALIEYGVTPIYLFILWLLTQPRYAYGLDIPDQVFEHESIREIERLGTDFVVLLVFFPSQRLTPLIISRQNDALSYCKEQVWCFQETRIVKTQWSLGRRRQP